MIINCIVKGNRRVIAYFIVCLVGLVCPSAQAQQSVPLDRIIAVVNDRFITQHQFDQAFKHISKRFEKKGAVDRNQLRYELMQQLINQEIQWQYALSHRVTITDQQVKQAVDHIVRVRYQGHSDQLERDLAKRHTTRSEYERNIRKDLMIELLQKQVLMPKIHIKHSDIERSWAQYLAAQQQKTSFHVRDIFLPFGSQEPSSDAYRQQIKQIALKLMHRVELTPQTTPSSSLPTPYGAQNVLTRDLGWRHLNDMPSVFAQKVVGMHVGQVSTPLKTGNGYHLVLLVDKKSPPSEHKLKKEAIHQWLWQHEFLKQLTLWIQKLRAITYVKIIHAPYTS